MKYDELVKGRTYRITGDSEYFKDKYGTSNPLFTYEDTDREVWGESWYDVFDRGNPCAVCFQMRVAMQGLDVAWDDHVLYGKCHVPGTDFKLGELVIPDELEEVEPATEIIPDRDHRQR